MKLDCPSCKHPMELADDMAGKLGRCPSCRQSFVVPGPEAAPLKLQDDGDLTLDAEGAVEAPAPPDPKSLKFCPQCGAKWKTNAEECRYCHYNAKLNAVLRPREKHRFVFKVDFQKIFLYILLFGVVFGVVWLYLHWGSLSHDINDRWDNATKDKSNVMDDRK